MSDDFLNLTIIRGDTVSITFTLTDENGDPVNLTGSTVYFTAKKQIDDDAADAKAVISKDVTSHSDPVNGETIINLTSSDTDIDLGIYFYDIQIKDSINNITSLPVKQLKVVEDVTRRIT